MQMRSHNTQTCGGWGHCGVHNITINTKTAGLCVASAKSQRKASIRAYFRVLKCAKFEVDRGTTKPRG